MKAILKLTNSKGDTILIGTESIISCTPIEVKNELLTKIQSRGAMVETFYVKETIIEIYSQYQKK
jgi:hypothetical protein